MIRPTDPDLLGGVAASLEQTVLPDLARGTAARRQLQAAIGILRRIAFALPQRAGSIAADNADMAETLRRIEMSNLEFATLPDDPSARHLALQEMLSALADSPDDAVQTILTALYRRMIDRELTLLPPETPRKKTGAPA